MPDSDDRATTEAPTTEAPLQPHESPPMVAELPPTMEESRAAWLTRME